EAEATDAKALHERDVFLVAMVEVVGDVAGLALKGFSRRMREGVPDRCAAAVFVDGALDLIAGRCGAPDEVLRKATLRWWIDSGHGFGGSGLDKRSESRSGGESRSGLQEGAAFHRVPRTTAFSAQRPERRLSTSQDRHPEYQVKRLSGRNL